jgi:hypothetical protein
MARLNPCPSCRDAFSLSRFSACAPDEHFVQNATYQGPKPISFKSLRPDLAGCGKMAPLRRKRPPAAKSRFHTQALPFRVASFSAAVKTSRAQAFFESLHQPLKDSEGLMCCLNWTPEKSNLDKSEAQPVPFDKLRAGSAFGVLHEVRQRHQVPREIRGTLSSCPTCARLRNVSGHAFGT